VSAASSRLPPFRMWALICRLSSADLLALRGTLETPPLPFPFLATTAAEGPLQSQISLQFYGSASRGNWRGGKRIEIDCFLCAQNVYTEDPWREPALCIRDCSREEHIARVLLVVVFAEQLARAASSAVNDTIVGTSVTSPVSPSTSSCSRGCL
jgi:hypothetical protein